MLQRKKIGNFKPKGRQVKIEAIKELYKIIGDNTEFKRDMLIEYLHLIQDANGYISSDLMEALSNEMKLPLVEVWEVASFYDHFDLIKDNETPPPKKTIRVCNSLSCFLNGSSNLIKELKEDSYINDDVRIIEAPCLGACDMAPAAAQKHYLIPKANKNKIVKILSGSKVKDPLENTIDFDQYINLRPVKLMQGVPCPLANKKPGDIDMMIVRENTEGEYSSVGGKMYQGTDREIVVQETVMSRVGIDRVQKFAFELAKTRKRKKLTSATKSNGISITMPYWDERVNSIDFTILSEASFSPK